MPLSSPAVVDALGAGNDQDGKGLAFLAEAVKLEPL